MKYKILSIAIILGTFYTAAYAQNNKEAALKRTTDSLMLEGISAYALLYPQLRQGNISFDLIGNTNVKAELNGKGLYEGKMNVSRIRSFFNVPITRRGKNSISAIVGYQQHHFNTTEIKSFDLGFPTTDFNFTKRTVSLSASFNRSDSIFNRPVFYSGTISGITDEASSIKRMNYIGTIIFPLTRNQHSSLSVGLVVVIDPSSVAPIIPVLSYWHKYKNSNVDLFIDIPSRVALRKQLSKKSWASFGSELGGNLMFFDINKPSLPQNNIYSYVELRTGATFEYLATKKIILGVNGGLFSTFSPRLFDKKDKPTDYFYKTNSGNSPFISFSISFLPFLKR